MSNISTHTTTKPLANQICRFWRCAHKTHKATVFRQKYAGIYEYLLVLLSKFQRHGVYLNVISSSNVFGLRGASTAVCIDLPLLNIWRKEICCNLKHIIFISRKLPVSLIWSVISIRNFVQQIHFSSEQREKRM